ncbi:S-adenosyl-L-methionine-dependent methyltransferase [Cercophora newfieldiana]|uniref:S-adenosyl-L-methionine-dependent methyltransferase n=1 Tax=Cercophora newfieldiana TaxID=92897 RepID=A0AA40CJE6_9PEZI|nr:S-adenosyl-L-methionine-dependent methyltransferase [Cercophora newfieldiana]
MAQPRDIDSKLAPTVEEGVERLDEQHIFTTKTLGFLIHPNIPAPSPTAKIADIGTGTGIWLLDVAKSLPPTCQFTGFDATSSSFPESSTIPSNVAFKIQDMYRPFPPSELEAYDIVAVRFTSSGIQRADWIRAVKNLMTLLKPGGWLQWIDSCNFALYNSVPGTSRAACQEIYDGLDSFRAGDDLVLGLMMREGRNLRREETWRGLGLEDVHEDVFSTDRLQEPELRLRDKGTRNIVECFVGCLESLVGVEGSGWTTQRIERLNAEAMKEVDQGVYHTLDQVCIVGRKPAGDGAEKHGGENE